jgi:acetyltransferase-like isoleucine patch superfamily enzyme
MRYWILNKCGWLFYLVFNNLYLSIFSLLAYGKLETLRKKGNNIGKNVRLGRHAQIHILKGGSISIGDNSCIEENSVIIVEKGGTLKIGSHCYLSRNIFLGCGHEIKIGDNVAIAGYVTIIDTNKNFEDTSRLIIGQGHCSSPVIIENDVWIGANATLLAGSHIGCHSVVAACSLVRSAVEPNTLIGGIPSRIIKRIGRKT